MHPSADTPSTERQLRLLEGIASTTRDFFYAFNLEHRFIYANERLLQVWGVAKRRSVNRCSNSAIPSGTRTCTTGSWSR